MNPLNAVLHGAVREQGAFMVGTPRSTWAKVYRDLRQLARVFAEPAHFLYRMRGSRFSGWNPVRNSTAGPTGTLP